MNTTAHNLYINNQLRNRGFIVDSIDFTQLSDPQKVLQAIESLLKQIDDKFARLDEERAKVTKIQNQNAVETRALNHSRFEKRALDSKLKKALYNCQVLELQVALLNEELEFAKLTTRQLATQQQGIKGQIEKELKAARAQLDTPITIDAPASNYWTTVKPPEEQNHEWKMDNMKTYTEIADIYEYIWQNIPESASVIATKAEPNLENLGALMLLLVTILKTQHMKPKSSSLDATELLDELIVFEKEHAKLQSELSELAEPKL